MYSLIPADAGFSVSLNGKWRFKLEQGHTLNAGATERQAIELNIPAAFEPFYKTDYAENADWHDLDVPGNWEMAGYSPATYWHPDNASAFYRTWIDIPADWAGRAVKINFDGVQNATEIWLNGQPVPVTEPSWGRSNYHESGWTAWQADLTDAAEFGERNLLALRVTKNNQSATLDSGDYYFLGGIYRPVTLFAVPKTHISDLTVKTHLLPDGGAELKVTVDVSEGQPTVAVRLEGFDAVDKTAEDGRAEFSMMVPEPRLWSAEHPNLYDLEVALKDSAGNVTERVERRIGIREVTIKDGIFLVNGVPVKLVGICRHDVSADEGTAVGEELWRKDLTLMKNANINSVRTSHYPYGAGFYDMCDEMGFYVIDELPYCWCPTDTDELTPAFAQRARETIARDKNHACVVIWGIGNENRPGKNLQVVADIVKQLDDTRPRLVSEQPADRYGVEFDDRHYTPPEKMQEAADDEERRAKWPMIYTENPNVWDIRFAADYGALDIWADVIKRSWDVVWAEDGICGLYLWEWQDRAVADKCPTKLYQFDAATGINYVKVKGLVDAYRNVRPDYYHVKMSQSPVQINPELDLASKPGTAILDVSNRYSFMDLSELTATWHLLKSGEQVAFGDAVFSLAPLATGKLEIELPQTDADALRIDFEDPRGWHVVSHQFVLTPPQSAAAMSPGLPDAVSRIRLNFTSTITVSDPATWHRVYRSRYKLENVHVVSGEMTVDADIVCAENTIVPESPAPTDEQRAKVSLPKVGAVVGHARAHLANGKFTYHIDWTGEQADIEELGWAFEMPKQYDRFSWDRNALWSVYPDTHIGRPTGTALPDSADAPLTKVTRPDVFDFVSTKYNCNWAALTDAKGDGLRIEFPADSREHVRAGITEDGHELIINKQCSPPRDISTDIVPDLYLRLSPGDCVEGEFSIGSSKEVRQ